MKSISILYVIPTLLHKCLFLSIDSWVIISKIENIVCQKSDVNSSFYTVYSLLFEYEWMLTSSSTLRRRPQTIFRAKVPPKKLGIKRQVFRRTVAEKTDLFSDDDGVDWNFSVTITKAREVQRAENNQDVNNIPFMNNITMPRNRPNWKKKKKNVLRKERGLVSYESTGNIKIKVAYSKPNKTLHSIFQNDSHPQKVPSQ